ncbi:hypothetical protein FYJ24_05500 [Actinomycetaceae bacterium WB03_NA08]|uniref:PASTA domain-containing protein n=1 Tax=Scrofimicrobium canadense TaxID=2652290 RepID=A0A6N7VR55_9ACTO|nr:hypothetical protein [Scrofimicrobium canadense]MSS84229.1 hypothetical protein [Scrofimicrobium canadense]
MKRIGASLTAILLALTLTACDDTDSGTTQSAEVIQSEPQASNQVGELLTIAEANLELEGYEVEAVSDDGKMILDKGNWTVIEQKQNDNQVLLTVTKNEETKSEDAPPAEEQPAEEPVPAAPATESKPEEVTNSQGLDQYGAVHACGDIWETALKNEFPASKVKLHTLAGILAATLDEDDTWFIKIEASVDKNTLNVECSVGGSLDQPEAVPLNVY